ncbi:MAG: hypothetical protein HC917_13310 [Richelia sp. SM2_1_7]|nr:hypothetical protein [Richelia sp. SM2_1_7]
MDILKIGGKGLKTITAQTHFTLLDAQLQKCGEHSNAFSNKFGFIHTIGNLQLTITRKVSCRHH